MIESGLREILSQAKHYKARFAFLIAINCLGCFALLLALSCLQGIKDKFSQTWVRLNIPYLAFGLGKTSLIRTHKIWPDEHLFLAEKNLNDLKQALPEIKTLAPVLVKNPVIIAAGNQWLAVPALGKTPEAERLEHDILVRGGRFIDPVDEKNSSRVVVLSPYVAHYLFGNGNALHQNVTLDGLPFTVIGVLDANKNDFSGNGSNVILPWNTAMNLWQKSNVWLQIELKPHVNVKTFEKILIQYLALRFNFSARDKTAVVIWDHEETRRYFQQTLHGIQLAFLISGASIFTTALFVYINFLNYFVKARKNEIILKLQLGFSIRLLKTQFLMEFLILFFLSFWAAWFITHTFNFFAGIFSLPAWLGQPYLSLKLTMIAFLPMFFLVACCLIYFLNARFNPFQKYE